MTTGFDSATAAERISLLRPVAMLLGVLLLADSLSQLVLAVGPWQPDVRAWRVANLRMVFSQGTPLILAAVLLVAGVRRPGAWRVAAVLLGFAAAIVAALGAALGVDAVALAGELDGPPLGEHKRRAAQAVLSAGALAFGLGGFALLSQRRARTVGERPAEP